MEEMTASTLQMKQYQEVKDKFGSKRMIGFSNEDNARLKDILDLLELRGYICKVAIDNTNAYERVGNFNDFEEWWRNMEQEKAKKENAQKTIVSIDKIVSNGGNVFLGAVTNSSFPIDNSISNIEKDISEKGGDDAEELKAILEEVRELIENIDNSRHIPKNKGLFQKITEHFDKHGWFYAEIVALLGAATMTLLQG